MIPQAEPVAGPPAWPPSDSLVAPEQLAELLGVAVKTVYQWNSLGTGPARMRVGKGVRYRISEVQDWLASRRTDGKASAESADSADTATAEATGETPAGERPTTPVTDAPVERAS